MSVTLYIGGQTARTQGEKQDLGGHRCFTAAYNKNYPQTATAIGLLDSGAFSTSLQQRLTPEQALIRQLTWEARASKNSKLVGLVTRSLLTISSFPKHCSSSLGDWNQTHKQL
ncbi:MAG: hypothetical protein N4J56_004524 [Chroococcidiopsis sp. SAG 2025]|uniref:hypothetical protein n=1 Tax=Chroococcidiopsis sp. SAG 2025 TaxID=171389 RepID=UPI002936F1DE|nr:hypothetical protein [Chroococcidiopsis sp. SAG 2025]MDV2994870.1 hypothetical protein [Chroococcidiopsis sp. SAG 2025]